MVISRAWESGRDVIGNYRIMRLLGRGGMGEVYLAWTGLRLVAIKVLNVQHANDSEFVEMFLSEARVAARINHSGIAQVLDVGMDGGQLFMVMEYVAGHTLDELLRDPAVPGLLPLRTLASMFAYVAHALATAHRAGVIHRDISPHNLLVSDTGAVKIIDFGIARTEGSAHTSPGTFRGRFGYMAPEYVQGMAFDHRVDLFALGVVMWEAFARQRLYAGAAAAQLFTMLERPADRLDEILLGFPTALADMVAKLLDRDPNQRYASADEVADELAAMVKTLPEDGFRNLEHWVAHHLSERIEARARRDREELQRVAGDEAVQRLSKDLEPEASAAITAVMTRAVTPLKVTFQGDRSFGADEDPSIIIEHAPVISPVIAVDRKGERSGAVALPIDRRGERSGAMAAPMLGAMPASMAGLVPGSLATPVPGAVPAMVAAALAEQRGEGTEELVGSSAKGSVVGGAVPVVLAEKSSGSGAVPLPGWWAQMKASLSGRQGMVMVAVLGGLVVVLSVALGLRGELRVRKGEWRAREARKELGESTAKLEQTEKLARVALEGSAGSRGAGSGAEGSTTEERAQGSSTRESEGALDGGEAGGGSGSGSGSSGEEGTGAGSAGGAGETQFSKAADAEAKAGEGKSEVEVKARMRPTAPPRGKGMRPATVNQVSKVVASRTGGEAGDGEEVEGGDEGAAPSAGQGVGGQAQGGPSGAGGPGQDGMSGGAPSNSSAGAPPSSGSGVAVPSGGMGSSSGLGSLVAPSPGGMPSSRTVIPPSEKRTAPAVAVTSSQALATPRVPVNLVGNEDRGAKVLGQCNKCHREVGAKLVGSQLNKTALQWERFFKNGDHDRNTRLGGRFSTAELADVKAYLMGNAFEKAPIDQGTASVRPGKAGP